MGQDALLHEKAAGLTRRLTGFRMTGTAPPPRPHYSVLTAEGQPLGEICSGTLSPTLQMGIGMAYLPFTHTTPGTPIQIEIRGKTYPAEVVKKPFYHPVTP